MRLFRSMCLSVFGAALAACSSTPAPQSGSSAPAPETPNLQAPLAVPALDQLPETPARPLSGRYQPAQWAQLPGWGAESGTNLWLTLYNNCRGLVRPVSGSLALPARAAPRVWQPVCSQVAAMGPKVAPAQAKAFLEEQLQPWKIAGQGMATGYYEPVVHGSRKRHGAYQWPMYGVPDDLLDIDLGALYPELAGKRVRGRLDGRRVVPYGSRADIPKATKQPPVIAWLNDPVEAFFLQVQGSGQVQLEGGGSLRLAYANHNGYPYTSIGKWLIEHGELGAGQASMQGIKAWAQQHPNRVNDLLNVNQAMVFFREEKVTDKLTGPKGAYELPLMAQRSVAVDPDYAPLGSPLYLSTTYPSSQQPLQRVVFAQDTGSAIKGPARVDYFWGAGDEAGEIAGRMKQPAEVWILWPKNAGEPVAR